MCAIAYGYGNALTRDKSGLDREKTPNDFQKLAWNVTGFASEPKIEDGNELFIDGFLKNDFEFNSISTHKLCTT